MSKHDCYEWNTILKRIFLYILLIICVCFHRSLLGLYWYYYYFSFTDHLQNFWSTADRFTSPWLPGAPANLLAPVSSKGEPTVRYRSYQGNSEEQIVEGGIRATKQIEMTLVNHRGLIGHTFSFWNGSECLWDGMLFSYILFFCR